MSCLGEKFPNLSGKVTPEVRRAGEERRGERLDNGERLSDAKAVASVPGAPLYHADKFDGLIYRDEVISPRADTRNRVEIIAEGHVDLSKGIGTNIE